MRITSRAATSWCGTIAVLLCVSRGHAQEPTPHPTPASVGIREDSGSVVIGDTDEQIWPNPIDRTYARMSTLRNLIVDFEHLHGRLPEPLQELSFGGEPLPEHISHDAWNHQIILIPTSPEFRLSAPGPDGMSNTADDLVLGRSQAVLRVPRDPARTTHAVMTLLQLLISLYHQQTGALPETLQQLDSIGLSSFLGVDDAWENPIRYMRVGSSMELRSAGPDERLATADDKVLTGLVPLPSVSPRSSP